MKLFGLKRTTETKITRKKKFSFLVLFAAVISLALLGSTIYYLPPTYIYTFFILRIPISLLFFVLVFSSFYTTSLLIFRSKLHGILIGSFVVLYLIFRLSNLTHPFFLILLAALFLTLELMIVNHRD